MNKKHLSFALISLLILTACGNMQNNAKNNQKDEIYNVIPPYIPPEKPDKNKEIINIEVLNLPNEIPVGYFDELDIEYRINYDDGSHEDYPLKEEMFPDDFRADVLGTVGEHKVAIMLRGNKVIINVKIVMSDRVYTVRFIDYDDQILYTQQVPYDNFPKYQGRTPFRDNDTFYRYKWTGWDHEHPLITSDLDIHATYTQTFKNNDMSPAQNKVSISDTYTSSSRYSWEEPNIFTVHSTYYVGTLRNVSLYEGSSYISHTQGSNTSIAYTISGDNKLTVAELESELNKAVNSVYSYQDDDVPSDVSVLNLSRISYLETSYVDSTIISKYAIDIDDYELYTATDNLLSYYDNLFIDDSSGTLTVPSSFNTGSYCASMYFDLDVYITYYLRKNADNELSIGMDNYIICPRFSYLGVHNEADAIDTTSSEDDHFYKGTVSDIYLEMKDKVDNHQW